MKNLDIEKLERKNIYQLPDHVFEKMQAKVLAETIPVQQAKIIKLNWIYSAAAAIALLFGLTFYINNDPKETPVNSVAQTTPSIEESVAVNTLSNDKGVTEEIQNSSKVEVPVNVESNKVKKTEVKSFAVSNQKSVKASEEVSAKKVQKAEIPMDQIIASFTSADLADLGRNTEQDVYLDLYN